MWYRIAQKSNTTYRWQTTDGGDALFIDSNATKDGFKAQPAILILFKIGHKKDVPFKKDKLKQSEIIDIFQKVQNELFKYPAGWVTERLGNDFQIQIVLDLEKIGEGQLEGYTSSPGYYVVLRKDGINYAIDHEIGHALDMKRISKLPFSRFETKNFDMMEFLLHQKDGTYMAPTGYGSTNNAEAFAEAYKILAQNGIKYRLPETTKDNIDQNRLFDYVEKLISEGSYKTKLQDFGNNLQFGSNRTNNYGKNNLNNQRIQTIVGGFQNAIDRFTGDKQKYGISLIQDKQKIKDVVEYLNKTQSEFFTTPATDEEIKLGIDYLKEKIDKNGYDQSQVRDRDRGVEQFEYEPMSLEFAPKALVNILDWMWENRSETKKTPGNKYVVENPYGQKESLSTQATQLLDNYFKSGSKENLVPINEIQSMFLRRLRGTLKKYDSSFKTRDISSDIYFQLINYGGIFPPSFSNPEEFLYYDYQITPQGYTLDTNSVARKIKLVFINKEFLNNVPENQKPLIEQQVMKMIQAHAVEYKKLLDYKQRDPKNPFPIEAIKNKFTPVNYFELAKKAITKIINFASFGYLNPNTRNINFLRIYNNDFFNANQKQELLNFYRGEQARRKQELLTQKPKK